ncbi:unnamed protein product [Parnassius mnemosyne]|uniref:C2H2-type domain-containing protein n=1 Tax=Parnassius mnemosyne TaxID=213953 RepID=A0AAV1KMX2_9NEOP
MFHVPVAFGSTRSSERGCSMSTLRGLRRNIVILGLIMNNCMETEDLTKLYYNEFRKKLGATDSQLYSMIETNVLDLSQIKSIIADKFENKGRYVDNPKIYLGSDQLPPGKESIDFTDMEKRSDKSTYCRPIVSFNNESFVSQSLKNNANLYQDLCKLVQEIQKEKQKRDWKRFITLLRKKHGCCNVFDNENHINIPMSVYKVSCEKNHERKKKLLQKRNFYESNFMCYPTSSLGRLTMRERENANAKKVFKPMNLVTKINKIQNNVAKCQPINGPSKRNIFYNIRNTLASQTENNLLQQESNKDGIRTQETTTQKSINELEIDKPNNLANIENKIDNLIKSINLFIGEIKTRNISKRDDYIPLPNKFTQVSVHKIKSDTCDLLKKCNVDIYTDNSITTVWPRPIPYHSVTTYTHSNSEIIKLNKTLTNITINHVSDKEINVRNKKIISRNNSLGTGIQIPRQEKSTEMTASFVNTGVKPSEVVIREENSSSLGSQKVGKRSKAANTEPLGVLALLRVSTETIRQLLSYMPAIDYFSYLPLLQLPHSNEKVEPQYVCKICGAAFDRASQLNDHIKGHQLSVTRDCRVCRHVLESQSHRHPNLFKCQYCGQRFTRAYCCELHQQSCAKHLGLCHDVPSSLMLLR